MIALADAQALLLSLAPDTQPVAEPLTECRGRWLAEPLLARRTQPWADISAMDGYALGAGNGPWRVISEIAAEARDPGTVEAGEATRIFTGAPLPAGADRVLIQEDAARDGDRLSATAPIPAAGRHIRRKGFDFAQGDVLAQPGTGITPAVIALAAVSGHAMLPVRPRTTVGILVTGSELIEPGIDAPGLPSSNGPMLAAMLGNEAHVIPDYRGIVGDDRTALHTAITRFEDETPPTSVLLLSGGASVGDHDHVRPVLETAGWTIAVHKVALKPGKPVMFATKGDRIAIGLPGNPVSAYVTCLLFALPLLRQMAGCPDPLPNEHEAILAESVPATGNREEFMRFRRSEDGGIIPLPQQDSGALRSLAEADGLIRLEPNQPPQDAGSVVRIITIT